MYGPFHTPGYYPYGPGGPGYGPQYGGPDGPGYNTPDLMFQRTNPQGNLVPYIAGTHPTQHNYF